MGKPRFEDKSQFNFPRCLDKYLTEINRENKEVYINGDFNTDLLKYEDNIKIREFYNLMV